MNMNRKKNLYEYTWAHFPEGFYLAEHSPGDGKTRYAIVQGVDDYFGGRAVAHALGLSEAEVMVRAFAAGVEAGSATAATIRQPVPTAGEGPLATYAVDFDQQAVTRWRVELEAPASLTDEEVKEIGLAVYLGGVPDDMPEKLAAIVNALLEQGAAPYEKDTEGFETEPVGVSRW